MGTAKQNRFNPDALCLSEQRIIGLWDAGQSIERITRATGYQRTTVSDTISRLTDGGETRRAHTNIATGSAQLLAAMKAERTRIPV